MFTKAMTIFAFSISLLSCATQAPPQPPLASSPLPPRPEPRPEFFPGLAISDLSLSETGSIVVKISNLAKEAVPKILEEPPIGPDIVVSGLDLTEDLELVIVLANAGELDARKGITVRLRIFVNGRKISEFEHFVSEPLKAKFGNQHFIDPPYRVTLAGISKVRVSISPKLPSDDVRLENNVLERTFVIFPFKIGPQGREEFSLSFYATRPWVEGQTERVKVEARWEGEASSLMLSFKRSGALKGAPTLSGKSPLKVEFPISIEESQKESFWSIVVTNPLEKKVQGHLIVQHP